jgi:hypothetical protein
MSRLSIQVGSLTIAAIFLLAKVRRALQPKQKTAQGRDL